VEEMVQLTQAVVVVVAVLVAEVLVVRVVQA
jgi:hypothetical protein